MIKNEYFGKTVKINISGNSFVGKVVELEDETESSSGEKEIGINYATGITMFRESEIIDIEVIENG